MKIKATLHNGNTIEYNQLENGTCYHAETKQEIVDILENARLNETRIRVFLGDVKTGKCWNEENDVVGTIGRSTGLIKIPLLIANKRSTGGGALLDDCIIKIITKDRVLYEHEKFNFGGTFFCTKSDLPDYKEMVKLDGEVIAYFKKDGQAKRYVNFITGARFSK